MTTQRETTQREPTQKETRSYAAYLRLLDTLRAAADTGLSPEKGFRDEIDITEGLRNALHLLSGGIDLYLEGDADRPEFVRIVSPTRKFMGDNPDAIYHFARVRGDRTVRITGRKTDECYISFTIHGRADDGRLGATAEPVLADVNDRGLTLDEEGRFELVLSADEHPGDWIRLPENAASIIVRHYYELEEYAPAADLDRRIELRIEALEPAGPRPPLTDERIAERLDDVNAFVRGATLEGLDDSIEVPFVSRIPNELPQPMVFALANSDTWGAVDIAYSMAPFELGPDEALVIEGRFPECAFANVVLWNKHMQCLEFRDHRCSLNRKQTVQGSDGSFEIVVASRDPGTSNWLDTAGHRRGTMFWRFLLPEGQPERPRCRVVPIDSLR